MSDSNDDKPPVPLEPEVLSLWKKVFPRLAHYFSYPEPSYARDFDDYGQRKKPRGGRGQAKRDDKPARGK